jgi:hypothetical protein
MESRLAHRLLDGLKHGVEIGASTHNPFGLPTLKVDYTDDPLAHFQTEQMRVSGFYQFLCCFTDLLLIFLLIFSYSK